MSGSHLTPADFTELREIIESFGLKPIILPDLSALDGSRQGMSALSLGGTKIDEIKEMSKSEFTIAIGESMETSAKKLKDRFNIEYKALESIAGLRAYGYVYGNAFDAERQADSPKIRKAEKDFD